MFLIKRLSSLLMLFVATGPWLLPAKASASGSQILPGSYVLREISPPQEPDDKPLCTDFVLTKESIDRGQVNFSDSYPVEILTPKRSEKVERTSDLGCDFVHKSTRQEVNGKLVLTRDMTETCKGKLQSHIISRFTVDREGITLVHTIHEVDETGENPNAINEPSSYSCRWVRQKDERTPRRK